MIIDNVIDMLDTMYPSIAEKVQEKRFTTRELSTSYGYVLSGEVVFPNGAKAFEKQYFSFWSKDSVKLKVTGTAVFFTRIGFKGQNNIGGPLEQSGRLCYIDGCSDSLLIYPPRMGDPSLNALYFPAGINQSFHIHPSVRLGVVAEGSGYSCVQNNLNGEVREIPLKVGDMFCIEERELHRFRTEDSHMIVVPYHPDGDWGPTDHNHTMLNRTYIKGTK